MVFVPMGLIIYELKCCKASLADNTNSDLTWCFSLQIWHVFSLHQGNNESMPSEMAIDVVSDGFSTATRVGIDIKDLNMFCLSYNLMILKDNFMFTKFFWFLGSFRGK